MPTRADNNLITDLRSIINERSRKQVNFMGKKIEINKLTLAECMEIQKAAGAIGEDNPEGGFDLLKKTIRIGVPAASDFEDSDFESFPMDDLNKLSEEVLSYGGMGKVGK